MTQEKQTSIRILQSKPQKKSLGKTALFLLGLLTGITITSIFFLIINLIGNTKPSLEDAQIEEKQLHERPNKDNMIQHDENTVAYNQHINEKDFNKIFKHENKPTPVKSQNISPFEQILKPESKPIPNTINKPLPKKTNTNQSKAETMVSTNIKISPSDQEEISPEGSVKMSIERKTTEDKP